MNLASLTQRFVLHFGELGSRWGISRTVGQIYPLLCVSPRALNADDIGEALAFSPSNVSMGLKELQSWNLVRLRHLPNDRREYFQAPEDVWAISWNLAEELRKREIDPTLSMLRDALMEQPFDEDDIHAQARMKQMHDLIELMKMGAKVAKLLEVKEKITGRVTAGLKGRPVCNTLAPLAVAASDDFLSHEDRN
jgi:DNA-binding transcriptional regulator GbsR (MarR family)